MHAYGAHDTGPKFGKKGIPPVRLIRMIRTGLYSANSPIHSCTCHYRPCAHLRKILNIVGSTIFAMLSSRNTSHATAAQLRDGEGMDDILFLKFHPHLKDVLVAYTKAVTKSQPADIYEWSARCVNCCTLQNVPRKSHLALEIPL